MKTSPLNNLKIASPCSADWNAMIGNDRKRFCGMCKLNVYNLSGMTGPEAEKLLIDSENRVCVRFYQRADGTVLTEDCPVGWARIKRNLTRAATAVFALIVGLFGGLFAFGLVRRTATVTMGNVAPVNTKRVPVEEDKDSCPPEKIDRPVTMGTPAPINSPKKRNR
jgi:hypothetical protein